MTATVVLVCVNGRLLLCNVGNFGGATVKFNSLHYYQENGSIARQEDVVNFGIRGLLEAKGIVIRKTVKKGVFHDFQFFNAVCSLVHFDIFHSF